MARGLFNTSSFMNNPANMNNSTVNLHEHGEEIVRLKNQVERLNLVTEALWTIMQKDGHTEEELLSAISDLDLDKKNKRQATADGEKPARRECPHCHVPLQNTDSIIDRCIYCGHEIIGNPFES